MNIERFVEAQNRTDWPYSTYETALKEVKNGCKSSHWIWYIFPQVIGLGSSDMSNKYAIKSTEEAIMYMNHPVLSARMQEILGVLLEATTNDAKDIFGSDSKKLKSSMTLFYYATNMKIFKSVLDKFFGGKMDYRTISILTNIKNA